MRIFNDKNKYMKEREEEEEEEARLTSHYIHSCVERRKNKFYAYT
jgi:hypothetical protein